MTDRSQITVSEPVAWILEIQREAWDATGTRKTGELYTERKIVEDEADAQWFVNTLGWVAAPLYTHPPSERVRELTDEECDRIASLALDRVAAKEGQPWLGVNMSIMSNNMLRRELVRGGYAAIAAEGLKEGG